MWAAWLTRLPTQCRWIATGPRPHGANATAGRPFPPPPPCEALHSTAIGTTQIHREVVKRAHLPPRMPARITVMSDSDGSPQRDDSHHRRSRSRSPFSPGYAGESLAEPEERRLAEAAVPVGPPAGQPRAASADTGPSTRGPAPAEETAPAAQAASTAAPPPEGAPGAQGAGTAAPASLAAARTAAPWRAASARGGPGAGPRGLAGSRRSRRGWRGGCTRSRDRGGPGGRAAPRRGPPQPQRRAGRAPSTAPTQTPATPAPAPPSRTPPRPPFLRDGRGTSAPRDPERTPPGVTLPQLRRQQNARRVIREGEDSAQAVQGAGHRSAERGTGGDRGSAQGQTQGASLGARGKERGRKRRHGTEASGSGGGQSAGSGRHDAGQGAGKGQGYGKGTQGRQQGAKAGGHGAHGVDRGAVSERGRSQGHGHGQWRDTGAGSAGQGAGDRGRVPQRGQGDKGVGAGKGPKGKGKGAVGPKGQTGRGTGDAGGGWREGRGTGCGGPPQPDVQPVRCIPPGIQQIPVHRIHHHHHHHAHLYNIDSDAGDPTPPQPPRPQHQPAPLAPRAEPARMAAASAAGGRDAAPAPQAQGPQGEPARGAEGGRPWDRDWDTVPDPLGHEALPQVVEVYGWLSGACSGTTRGMRNQPFDAVLLRRDGGNRAVPPGGWAAPEDHERVLRAVTRAAWPNRGPAWTAFLEGGAVLRITDADANNWLPRALRNALTQWRYRRRNPPPRSPIPHHSDSAGDDRAPSAQAMGARGSEGDCAAGRPARHSRASRPTPAPAYSAAEGRAPPPVEGGMRAASARGSPLPRSPLTADP